MKNEINKYKSERWCTFLSTIQEAHHIRGKLFWSHLSKLYKPKTLPLSKLTTESDTISDHQEIATTLYNYYKDQAKAPLTDHNNPHDSYIEKEHIRIQDNLFQATDANLQPISVPEVIKLIKRLKNKMSSGYDRLSNHMMKLLPQPTSIA